MIDRIGTEKGLVKTLGRLRQQRRKGKKKGSGGRGRGGREERGNG
jgi:hypothetical protein